MLSQRSSRRSIAYTLGLMLFVGISAMTLPMYAEGTSAESEGLPGSRVGGGTRVIVNGY